MGNKVLILEDSIEMGENLIDFLNIAGFDVKQVVNSKQIFQEYPKFMPDILLIDICLKGSDYDGVDTFRILKRRKDFNSKVLILSAGAPNTKIAEAMKLGALNFIEKNAQIDMDRLVADIQQGIILKNQEECNRTLKEEKNTLKKYLQKSLPFIGECDKILEAKHQIKQYAKANVGILVEGETGTGKEIVANTYYHNSPRFGKSFNKINCAALTETIVESELFGHNKGAFTGASGNNKGIFEQSNHGVLFLDEISNLSYRAQAKILRVIANKEIQVVGGTQRNVDIKLVCATNVEIEKLVNEYKFRSDLLYRINANVIKLPPLRERGRDIVLLFNYFMNELKTTFSSLKYDYNEKKLKDILHIYSWPGNIRELGNLCENMVIAEQGSVITNSIIERYVRKKVNGSKLNDMEDQLTQIIRNNNLASGGVEFEKKYIEFHLKSNSWNFTITAKKIGISRSTLHRKAKQFNLAKSEPNIAQ